MSNQKSKPWVKVWESWWASRSHAGLDGVALAVGLRCLSLANGTEPDASGAGWLVTPDGRPLSVEVIARESRFSVELATKAVAELIAVGTMARRKEDGALGFPRLAEYQESPSTARVRRHRMKRYSNADGNGPGNASETTRGQRSEIRSDLSLSARKRARDDDLEAIEPEVVEEGPGSPSGEPGSRRSDQEASGAPAGNQAPQAPSGLGLGTRPSAYPTAESMRAAAADGDPPSVEWVVEAWVSRGRPRPESSAAVELLVERAVLAKGRSKAWVEAYFDRVTAAPWCRGEVYDQPHCVAWGLDYALQSERRIREVLDGKFDERPSSPSPAARPAARPAPRGRGGGAAAPAAGGVRSSLQEVSPEELRRFQAARQAELSLGQQWQEQAPTEAPKEPPASGRWRPKHVEVAERRAVLRPPTPTSMQLQLLQGERVQLWTLERDEVPTEDLDPLEGDEDGPRDRAAE